MSSLSFSGALVLATWLMLNVSTTLVNKAIFQYGNFPFPLTLSAMHYLITGIGATVFCWLGGVRAALSSLGESIACV